MRRAVVGVDHGGLAVKERIIACLREHGYEVKDMGVFSEDRVDYPDKVVETYREYSAGGYDFAVLACGTGIGVSITANKLPGVRCALPQNSFAARMAREHNNANFIAFGGRIDYSDSIEDMLEAYIGSEFAGDRHQRRVVKIMELE
jgi:ribose 5-phosphate isomerase B